MSQEINDASLESGSQTISSVSKWESTDASTPLSQPPSQNEEKKQEQDTPRDYSSFLAPFGDLKPVTMLSRHFKFPAGVFFGYKICRRHIRSIYIDDDNWKTYIYLDLQWGDTTMRIGGNIGFDHGVHVIMLSIIHISFVLSG